MYATFDRRSPTQLDAEILSLSWKGGAKQGWLASGNSRKTVGVTHTQIRDDDETEGDVLYDVHENSVERQAMRRNFNFREHSKEVTIVRWNKHLDKIATCDASGTVIVWRNHNGRSIMELVNNRGTPISDFQWSNDGNKVLIAYTDGYVLVGTAYGRRIWVRQLNLGSFVTSPASHPQPSRLLSSTWSPDDTRIVVGSSIGELIELDAIHGGTLVSTTEVLPGIGIIGLQWVYGPKTAPTSAGVAPPVGAQPFGVGAAKAAGGQQNVVRLSLYLRNGKVVLMNSCGDQQATIIRTGLVDGKMLWSSSGSILAVAGFRKSQAQTTVRFFQPMGQLMFTLSLETKEQVTAITWAHADQKLFVATKNLLHTITVHRNVPSLQLLCGLAISTTLSNRESSYELLLPTRLKATVAETFDSVIQGHVPEPGKLLDYVVRPPPPTHRVYCTVIPSSPVSPVPVSGAAQRYRHPSFYTLYVEHMGTLIPILEAHKRSSKIRQSFAISLPTGTATSSLIHSQRLASDTYTDLPQDTVEGTSTNPGPSRANLYTIEGHNSLNTESGIQVACRDDEGVEAVRHSPQATSPATVGAGPVPQRCVSSLDQSWQLAEVTSNVMASKFRIQSLCDRLPSEMGAVTIKTSFLHIQPRKVIVLLPQMELNDSGIDSDHSSSDDSATEDTGVHGSGEEGPAEVEKPIESLMSMEDLQLPRAIELESQTLRPVETQTLRACSHGMRTSSSDSHIQILSKTPTWNEQHMIYQLDFGGRVTTKSAKNFQLELANEQVLQFGRIDNGAFILDFQAPFSPVQAFATALANLV